MHAKPYIGEARPVAVAMLEAEIDHAANDERTQVLIGKQRRRHELRSEHPESRGMSGSLIKGKSMSSSIVPASKLGPDPLVFAPHFIFGRMRRPIDAQLPEVFETRPPPRGRSDPRSCKASRRKHATAAMSYRLLARGRQHRQPLFRRRQLAGQELAFGPVQLQSEDELVVGAPSVSPATMPRRRRDTSAPRHTRSKPSRACPR